MTTEIPEAYSEQAAHKRLESCARVGGYRITSKRAKRDGQWWRARVVSIATGTVGQRWVRWTELKGWEVTRSRPVGERAGH